VFLFLRFRHRLAPGSLLLIFFVWYGAVRFGLEALRQNNWVLFGIPTAQLVSIAIIAIGLIGLVWRNRRGSGAREPAGAVDAPEALTTDASPRS
jgi:prolipoprotein diacylglyceryltransferase